MFRTHKLNPVVRATGVIGVVAGLVTGVTFAALQSQATLTDNTIASATANLEVQSVGEVFSDSDLGFAFNGVIPGGPAVLGVQTPITDGSFQLRNSGDTSLSVLVTMPNLPVWSDTVNNSKVHLLISCSGAMSSTFDSVVQTVYFSGANLGNISNTTNGGVADCVASVSMEIDAFTGSGVNTTSGFDLVFTGTAI